MATQPTRGRYNPRNNGKSGLARLKKPLSRSTDREKVLALSYKGFPRKIKSKERKRLMKQKKAEQVEQALERENNVSRATTIKQLVGLAVSKISEELLEKAVTNVQKTFEQVDQSEKAYEDARIVGVDVEGRTALLVEWQTSLRDYRAACVCFADILLAQVFAWLEGGKK